jgi:hypothetical protein
MRVGRASRSGACSAGHLALGLLVVTTALHLAGAGLAVPPGVPAEERAAAAGAVDLDAARARACLKGRAALHVEWLMRVGRVSEDQREDLRIALEEAVEETVEEAQRAAKTPDPDWLEAAWQTSLSSQAWEGARAGALKTEQGEALAADLAARAARLEAASVQVLLTALAVELRLREPQAEAVRDPIMEWMGDPRWQRVRATSTDLNLALASSDPVKTLLVREQVSRLVRMRRASALPAGRGEALTLQSGRYPEDEFVLEALALAAFHGWDEGQAALLLSGATAMGRRVRREKGGRRAAGDRNPLRAVVDPDEQPLWQALVRREEARHGAEAPAPEPWTSGDREALVDARTRLMLAQLDRVLLLEDGPREALGAALAREVGREINRGALGLGAIGAAPIWRALRLPLRFDASEASVQPRPELLVDLYELLSATQLRALGIKEEG